MSKEDDTYKDVPNHGKPFQEGGNTFFWNFSHVAIGTIVDEWRDAITMGAKISECSCHATKHWYRTHITAVDNASVAGGTIIKWKHLEGHKDTKEQPGTLESGRFYEIPSDKMEEGGTPILEPRYDY